MQNSLYTLQFFDWHGRLTLDPPWVSCKQSDRHCVDSGAGEDKMSSIKQLDVIMNIAVVIYSRHMSRWRRRGLTLLSFLNASIPDLPKCIYVRANHSWSSFIYWSSEYKGFLQKSLQIAFPKMCWLASFVAEVYSLLVTPRKRGAVSAELISI